MPKGFRQYDRVERQHTSGSDAVNTGDPNANGLTSGRTVRERMGDGPGSHEAHMPNPAAGAPAQWWWDTQPGIGADWLPEDLFPEIDELREEHLERLAAVKGANGKVSEIIEGFEAEDAARDAALYAGESVPAVTNTAERTDAVRQAEAEAHAARLKLDGFYRSAVERIKELAPVFQKRFANRRAEHAAAVEKAREALRQAERETANVDQAEQWVERTVEPLGGRYMPAPKFGEGFMTEAEREDYRRGVRDIEAEMRAVEPTNV